MAAAFRLSPVLALLLATAAHARPCSLSLAAALPLVETTGAHDLVVNATVDGAPARLILDTGSEGILLNETYASHASRQIATGTMVGGLAATGRGFALGVGGSRAVTAMQIGNLGLGRLHGTFSAMATDQSFDKGGADGLMGMSVLGNFDVDLDLPDGQVRLYTAAGSCHAPAVALAQPIYAAPLQGGFHTEVRPLLPVVINGHTFTALLDTGAPGVLLFARAAAELGLSTDATVPQFALGGVGGGSHATMARLQTLAIGPITLRNIAVAVDHERNGEADLLLGLSFMRKVHVWISNSSHTLVMQYPPTSSPSLATN